MHAHIDDEVGEKEAFSLFAVPRRIVIFRVMQLRLKLQRKMTLFVQRHSGRRDRRGECTHDKPCTYCTCLSVLKQVIKAGANYLFHRCHRARLRRGAFFFQRR